MGRFRIIEGESSAFSRKFTGDSCVASLSELDTRDLNLDAGDNVSNDQVPLPQAETSECCLLLQLEVCKEQVEWAKAEKRTFLRQRIEARLANLYLETRDYAAALALISRLSSEVCCPPPYPTRMHGQASIPCTWAICCGDTSTSLGAFSA